MVENAIEEILILFAICFTRIYYLLSLNSGKITILFIYILGLDSYRYFQDNLSMNNGYISSSILYLLHYPLCGLQFLTLNMIEKL